MLLLLLLLLLLTLGGQSSTTIIINNKFSGSLQLRHRLLVIFCMLCSMNLQRLAASASLRNSNNQLQVLRRSPPSTTTMMMMTTTTTTTPTITSKTTMTRMTGRGRGLFDGGSRLPITVSRSGSAFCAFHSQSLSCTKSKQRTRTTTTTTMITQRNPWMIRSQTRCCFSSLLGWDTHHHYRESFRKGRWIQYNHPFLISIPTTTSQTMRSRQRAMSSSSSTTHPEQESTTTTNTTQGDDETIRHDSNNQQEVDVNHTFYDDNVLDFASLGVQSPILLERLHKLGFHRPAAVQAQAFQDMAAGDQNITLGAETGSGKTLAYLLPLMDDILQRKQLQKLDKEEEAEEEEEGGTWEDKGKTLGYDYARAIILVPNKELVQQVIRMALPLAGGPQALVYGGATLVDLSILGNHTFTHQGGGRGLSSSSGSDSEGEEQKTLVRLAILPGGLKEPSDFPPFRQMLGGKAAPVDLIIATPATLGPFGLKPRNIAMFADVETLVIDEADMLLDGGYIRSLEQVLMGFRRADRLDYSLVGNKKKTQHVFVAATIPDSGLRSVDAFLSRKFPTSKRMTMTGMHKARHSGLAKNTVWIEEDSYKERMAHMCQLLDTPSEEGGLRNDKVMVFLSTVKDVEGVCDALAQAGFQALTYHADLSLKDRTKVLNEFRRYEKPQQEQPYNQDNVESDVEDVDKESSSQEETNGVPILVCTDLASRGLDVPGVTAIVQMQFASNVVAHLHRMGRCGRAGQRVGRGIVYFSSKEKPLVDVVRQAEQEQVREGESATGLTLQGPDVVETPQMEDSAEQNNDDDNDSKMESIRQREAGTVNQAFSRKRGFTKKRKKYRKLAEAAAAEATAAVEEED